VDGAADAECGDIDREELGKVLREAADLDGADALLEQAAEIFHSIGLAGGLDRHIGGDLLGGGDSLEIDMEDVAGDGVVLDLLDERKLGGFFGAILDLEFDEDVFADGVGEEGFEFATGDFEIRRGAFPAVNDGGDGTAGADAFDGIATAFGAGTGGELDLLGHDGVISD
jgi:hypothetical protein